MLNINFHKFMRLYANISLRKKENWNVRITSVIPKWMAFWRWYVSHEIIVYDQR